MLLEIEKRNTDEIRRLIAKEVRFCHRRRHFFFLSFDVFIFQEEERKKREDLEKILAENERKLVDAQKRLVGKCSKQ